MNRGRLGFLLFAALAVGCRSAETVTIIHFTDYHSHAVPFYANGELDAAGIARAFAYVEPLAARDDVLLLSGGDTINRGAPAWSDEFGCVEWPWWNGIVDAMAYGNHDADYGPVEFSRCRASVTYPILSANTLDATGRRIFDHEGKPYVVFERRGVRIGVFALAGPSFARLVKPETSPVEGVHFAPPFDAAREIVRQLRDVERVNAVMLIGHEDSSDDDALARNVEGIDLILGTHSHVTRAFGRIEGTNTWTISSGQYLEHVSRVDLRFDGGRLRDARGEVIAMGSALPEDRAIKVRVAKLQAGLENDPKYAELFRRIGSAPAALDIEGLNDRNALLGTYVMSAVRDATTADLAISTSSSFRSALPAGSLRETDLRDALPYDNAVLRYEVSGTQLTAILDRVISLRGTDSFCQLAGGELGASGAASFVGGNSIDPAKTYMLATTDYLARVSVYRDLFAGLEPMETSLYVRALVRHRLGLVNRGGPCGEGAPMGRVQFTAGRARRAPREPERVLPRPSHRAP